MRRKNMFGGFRKRKKEEKGILGIVKLTTKKNMEIAMSYLARKLFKTHEAIINELSLEENHLIPTKHKIKAHNWLAKEEVETIYDEYIESKKRELIKKI
jgi:hypothetical protein